MYKPKYIIYTWKEANKSFVEAWSSLQAYTLLYQQWTYILGTGVQKRKLQMWNLSFVQCVINV